MAEDDLSPDDVQEIMEEAGSFATGRSHLIEMWQWAWKEFVLDRKPRCINSAQQPVYRGEGGCCCPIGRFMPSIIQLDSWENMQSIGKLMFKRQDVSGLFKGIRASVLIEFQSCHDCGELDLMHAQIRPYHLAMLLKKFAVKHKLDIS